MYGRVVTLATLCAPKFVANIRVTRGQKRDLVGDAFVTRGTRTMQAICRQQDRGFYQVPGRSKSLAAKPMRAYIRLEVVSIERLAFLSILACLTAEDACVTFENRSAFLSNEWPMRSENLGAEVPLNAL